MANWWEDAPLVEQSTPGNWWEAAPLVEERPRASGQHLSFEEGAALLDRQARMAGGDGAAGAAMSSFLDGVPIVGPYLVGGAQRGAAALSSLFNGESYDTNLREARALTNTAQRQHPYVAGAAGLAGGVAGTLPMIAAAPAAFGATGGIAARSLASAASGGAIGTVDSGVRSDWDPDAMWNGTKWGVGIGVVGPTVGNLVGSGARYVVNRFANKAAARAAGTTPYAVDKFGKAAAADGLDDAALRARLDELGPEGMFADLGPNLQGQASALANMPGPANAITRSALNARSAGANARIASTVDETMGREVIPSQIEREIGENMVRTGPMFDEAMQGARGVDTTPIAEGLESQMVNLRGEAQKAARDVRKMLNITGTDVLDPNPGTLFQTRQAIDGLMKTETNPQVIRTLTMVRKEIDDTLAGAAPRLKEADAVYSELRRQESAIARGQTVLDSGRTAPRPAELAQELQEGALPQGLQIGPSASSLRLSQGARADVARILGNKANDIAELNRLIKGEGDWNRSRLSSLFGPKKANELFRVLDNELKFADTKNFATGNSFTAGRQEAIRDLGGRGAGFGVREAYSAGGVRGAARATGLKAVDKVFGAMLEKQRQAGNASLAKAITSNRLSIADALLLKQMQPTSSPAVEAVAKALLLSGGSTGSR